MNEIAAAPHRGSQFGNPRGLAGRLVGRLMARKNHYMNRLAVEQLAAPPDHRILEIGYGPGAAVELLARRVTDGLVAGIDVSPTMHAQASRRNRRSIDAGRVELRVGSADSLPFADASFDQVFEINCFHHWPDQAAALAEIRRVLRPAGLLLLCLRMKHDTRTRLVAPGHTPASVDRAEELLGQAGFAPVTREVFELERRVTCVRGRR